MQINKFRSIVVLSLLASPIFAGCGQDSVFAPESPVVSDLAPQAVSIRVRQERVFRGVLQLPYEQQVSVASCSGFYEDAPVLAPDAGLAETVRYTEDVDAWRARFQAYINTLTLSDLVAVNTCIANPSERSSTPDVGTYSASQLANLADCAGYPAPPAVNPSAPLNELVSQTESYNAWRTGFVSYVKNLPLERLVRYTDCARAKENITQA